MNTTRATHAMHPKKREVMQPERKYAHIGSIVLSAVKVRNKQRTEEMKNITERTVSTWQINLFIMV